ncbi:MAG: hypothetical protein MH204_01460 [Fimbriimonadaceae bacterium]|nr:hypothetical protein [Fimbriimonadaceae bacterium]
MNPETYLLIKLTCGALATIGLYSVLYKETKIYRFFEHLFIGLSVGFAIFALWKETLYVNWWQKMLGKAADGSAPAQQGLWLFAILVPIGLMGYMVFSKKHNWMSRIPIGIILGAWSGQQLMNWSTQFFPQIYNSMKPIVPTTWESIRVPSSQVLLPDGTRGPAAPEVLEAIQRNVFPTQALTNIIFLVTLLASLSYFIFSIEIKGKALQAFNKFGRWTLMIGFGCIFGSTVMARFALVIDRMSYIVLEWLVQGVLPLFRGG